MSRKSATTPKDNILDLTKKRAVCVVSRNGEGVGVICYDSVNRSPTGAQIRTYLPGRVDGRWDGPLLTTAAEVFTHLGKSEEPCSVPVLLARSLFNWTVPFADLPEYGDESAENNKQ